MAVANRLLLAAWLLLLGGCTGIPDGMQAVSGFELNRYLGTWYEIARLDHSFERGLSKVTAGYSLNDDGSVRVVNRGYDAASGEWQEAEGRALLQDEAASAASLKVSFFGPFYAGYHIIALDPDYRWALVSGYNRDYFWILARTPTLDEPTRTQLVALADAADIALEQLIWVAQD